MNHSRCVLVAGIGNIFFGDDAFGVEVVRRIGPEFRAGVKVVDFGIRGLDLAFALLEPYEMVIFVDAISRSASPGMLFLLEISADDLSASASPQDEPNGHSINPLAVLRLAAPHGRRKGRVLVLGCEPASLEPVNNDAGLLSPPVCSAVPEAIVMLQSLVDEFLQPSCSIFNTALS